VQVKGPLDRFGGPDTEPMLTRLAVVAKPTIRLTFRASTGEDPVNEAVTE
jgi:hypothetical protein